MNNLEFGAYQAVEKCMKVKPQERVVIIADRKTDEIAKVIQHAALKITPQIQYFIMEDFGQRPFKIPNEIMDALKNADVSFYTGDHVAGELELFREPIYDLVAQSRLRHANMLAITREIMEQGMNADYDELKKFTGKVFGALRNSRSIEVYTDLGTELHVKVGKYKWVVCDGDIRPGNFSNLPDGEVFTSPENIEGKVVIDGILGDYFGEKYGLISDTPLHIEIRDCHAINGTLKCSNPDIEKALQAYIFRKNSPNSTRVGEFALGTNLQLEKIIGNLLQDEKFPSVHIAFGDCCPQWTGCPYPCDYHIDGIILKPTVITDGFKLMDSGKYQI